MDDFAANKAENKVLGQFAGLSMVLKSETTLNLFYEPKEGIDVSKLTFSVDGKEITPVKRGQYYILSLENIRAVSYTHLDVYKRQDMYVPCRILLAAMWKHCII